MIEAVGEEGPAVVYNRAMESERLRELARDFPDLADELLAIDGRTLDLLPFVRKSCYHPSFHGSRSLKQVAPVLAPHLSYQDLDLKGGMQAMEAYETIIDPGTGEAEREKLRRDLRAYCGVDTLAMVEIYRRLMDEVHASGF